MPAPIHEPESRSAQDLTVMDRRVFVMVFMNMWVSYQLEKLEDGNGPRECPNYESLAATIEALAPIADQQHYHLVQAFVQLHRYCKQQETFRPECRRPLSLIVQMDAMMQDEDIGDVRQQLFAILFGSVPLDSTLIPAWRAICLWAGGLRFYEVDDNRYAIWIAHGLEAYRKSKEWDTE